MIDDTKQIPDWLPTSAATLQSFLKTHPDTEKQVSEILNKLLEKTDANSGSTVVTALDGYFGQEITDMLFDLVQPDYSSRLQEFTPVIPAEAMSFLKKFIAQYATKLNNLTQATTEYSASALDTFLDSHPEAEEQVLDILAKHLEKIEPATWNSIVISLDNYWGKDCTNILIEIARQPDQTTRLEETSKSASPKVMDFLRRIISLYGTELGNAVVTANQLSNGWKMFYREVYYDYVNRRPLVRIRIAKYNGEEPVIEGNADTMLEFTILMMQTLRFLPVSEFFGKEMANRFIRDANEFIKFLQPPVTDTSEAQPEQRPSSPS